MTVPRACRFALAHSPGVRILVSMDATIRWAQTSTGTAFRVTLHTGARIEPGKTVASRAAAVRWARQTGGADVRIIDTTKES